MLQAVELIWSGKPETASRVCGRTGSAPDRATARGYRKGENPHAGAGHLVRMMANDPDAKAGLERAVADYIAQKFVGVQQLGTCSLGALRSNAIQASVKRNSLALACVFSGEQLRANRNIAADLQRSDRSLYAINVPGQSNTTQDIAQPGRLSMLRQCLSQAIAATAGGVVLLSRQARNCRA